MLKMDYKERWPTELLLIKETTDIRRILINEQR